MSATEAFAKELAELITAKIGSSVPKKDLYTLDDAAVFLACSRDQVRKLMDAGKLRAVRIDSRPRFRLKDLERFVELAKV